MHAGASAQLSFEEIVEVVRQACSNVDNANKARVIVETNALYVPGTVVLAVYNGGGKATGNSGNYEVKCNDGNSTRNYIVYLWEPNGKGTFARFGPGGSSIWYYMGPSSRIAVQSESTLAIQPLAPRPVAGK